MAETQHRELINITDALQNVWIIKFTTEKTFVIKCTGQVYTNKIKK